MNEAPAHDAPAPSPIHRRLAAIMAVFFLLSWLGLVPVAWQANRDYRTVKVYVETSCEILQYLPVKSGDYRRPGKKREITIRPSFVFRFDTLEGESVTTRGFDSYGGREAPRREWGNIREGERHACWYDPANPSKAVLSRRFNPHFYWVLAFPLSVMASSRRRSASPPWTTRCPSTGIDGSAGFSASTSTAGGS